MPIILSEDQKEALELILTAKIGVVTGPPGVGKSTIIGAALRSGMGHTLLVAPTGKAARRMEEVTGHPAATIHRALGARPSGGYWTATHDEGNPLPHSVVIVDEASMVDVELGEMLLRAINTDTTRLIFVGDVDQLPSVGPGRVFGDLIDSGAVPVARLRVIHRAAASTWVFRVAPKILEGNWEWAQNDPTYKFSWSADAKASLQKLVEIVSVSFRAKGIDDYQVLSPMYRGHLGVTSLNNALQEALNPREYSMGEPELEIEGKDYRIRARDRVVQGVNDYNKLVFNGEMGVVSRITPEMVGVVFDGHPGEILYEPKEAFAALSLAYALSIHKFQGSEAQWVVVACTSEHARMWSRQLLYTAVTRARRGVVMIGDKPALYAALGNNDPAHRSTLLQHALMHDEVT